MHDALFAPRRWRRDGLARLAGLTGVNNVDNVSLCLM